MPVAGDELTTIRERLKKEKRRKEEKEEESQGSPSPSRGYTVHPTTRIGLQIPWWLSDMAGLPISGTRTSIISVFGVKCESRARVAENEI